MFDMRDAVCDKMEDEFEKRMETLRKAQELAEGPFNALNDALDSIVPSDGFNDALNSIPDVPETDMREDVQNILVQCAFLSDLFGDPTDLVRDAKDAALRLAKSLINALDLPEISAAMLIDALKELFGINGLDLKSLLEAMDKILNCLTAICGRETQNKVDEMQGILDDLHITDTGEFDSGSLFSAKGLTGDVVNNMNSAQAKITSAKDSITSKIDSYPIPGISLPKLPGI